MIAGIKDIESKISNILKEFEIKDFVEIRYSNIENTDIQCNNLVRYSNNPNINEIKEKLKKSLLAHPYVKNIEIAENGFINLNFSNEYLRKFSKNHSERIISPKKSRCFLIMEDPILGKIYM